MTLTWSCHVFSDSSLELRTASFAFCFTLATCWRHIATSAPCGESSQRLLALWLAPAATSLCCVARLSEPQCLVLFDGLHHSGMDQHIACLFVFFLAGSLCLDLVQMPLSPAGMHTTILVSIFVELDLTFWLPLVRWGSPKSDVSVLPTPIAQYKLLP